MIKRLIFILIISLQIISQKTYSQQVIILTDSTEIPEIDLDEIEVSASKSSLTLKKMPGTVNLVSSKIISEHEIQSLTDLSAFTPGFFMPDYGSKLTSPVYIRGIGSRINSPSVGLYVDNVPYFEKASYNFDFFDVERIEILKGPQGTLYGRNAMGGIINVITRSPFQYHGTRAELSAGAYGVLGAKVSHYNSIGKTFGYSLSVNYLHKNGYYTNSFLDTKVDDSNSIGFRNKLSWKINDKITVKNIINFENSQEGGYPYARLIDGKLNDEGINYNQPSSYNRSLFSDALLFNFDGEYFKIRSTTSYQYLDDQQSIDQDFTADSLYFVVQEQFQHMISQEFIIRSPKNSRFNWLFGAYGFMQRFDKHVDVEMYQRNMTALKKYDKSVGGAAVFHQSTINDLFIENLSVTAGIRLDFERDILDYVYDIDRSGNVVNMTDTIYPDLSYVEVLPKIALNYKLNNSSIYAVVSKGYKTGGFNSTFYKDEDLFFNPEYSWSYEIGTKSILFDRSVYADLSLFYIDWRNQQIYQPAFYRDDTPAPGSLLKNAGRSNSKGIEISIKTLPVFGFMPSVSYGYTHATFTDYVIDDATDYSGNFIPYVPKHTLNANLKRYFHLKNKTVIDKIGINLIYRGLGEVWWNEENMFKTDFYNLIDGKLSFHRNDLSLEIWGKNILNAEYESFYFEAIGNQYVQTGKPLRVGINLKFDF